MTKMKYIVVDRESPNYGHVRSVHGNATSARSEVKRYGHSGAYGQGSVILVRTEVPELGERVRIAEPIIGNHKW